jgi:hypothetical protein
MMYMLKKFLHKQPSVLLTLLACLFIVSCEREPIGPKEPDPANPAAYMTITEFRAIYPGSGDYSVPWELKRSKVGDLQQCERSCRKLQGAG